MSRAVNKELKKDKSKVRVSILCPGPVRTNFNNVAGVKFELSSLSSEYVARYAINKVLKGKEVIVPGILIKVTNFLNKILPSAIMIEAAYHMQKSKGGKGN